MRMINNRLSNLSLVQKLISMIFVVLFLVASLLIVNAIVTIKIKSFIVSLVEDKVTSLLDNTATDGQFDQLFSDTHSILIQFPTGMDSIENAETHFKAQLASIDSDKTLNHGEIGQNLIAYSHQSEQLFDLLTRLAQIQARIQDHVRAINYNLELLDRAVLEHELQLVDLSQVETEYVRQLAILLPALYEINHELELNIIHIQRNFLNTERTLVPRRHALESNLEELTLALRSIPLGFEDTKGLFEATYDQIRGISEAVVSLFETIDLYRKLFQENVQSKSLLISSIDELNQSIAFQSGDLAANVNHAISKAIQISSLLSLTIIALLFLIAGLTKRFTRPIKQLSSGVKKVGEGDLNFRVKVDTQDEISRLATSFNQMTENLKQTMVSKAYVESILDNMNESLIVLNTNCEITGVNAKICQLLAYTEQELLGQPAAMLFERDDARILNPMCHNRGHVRDKTQSASKIEVQFMSKNGQSIPVIMSQALMPGNSHDSDRIVCLAVDITERKRWEDAIAEEKERLNITLRSIGDGVICTDRDGRVTLLNRIAEELTGYSQAIAIGKPLESVFKIVNEITREPIENPARKVVKTGIISGLANHTLLISSKGHEFVIEDSAAPILNSENEIMGVVLVFRDITEKRHVEAERLKTQKLESMAILAGGIAHDFNNYLTAIMGNLSLAKMDAIPGDPVMALLDKMENASIQAKGLTQQLLTFSKGGEPVMKIVSLPETVKNTISFSLRGSNVLPEINIDEDLPLVEIDEGQISQVIHNLILNADQAMPDGGRIRVSLSSLELLENNQLKLPQGDYVRLSIEDQGCGIPSEHLSKIFDPYFTTKSKGSGLGLTAAYAIIEKHQGKLSVASTLGQGTLFQVHFPIPKCTNQILSSSDPPIAIGKGKVLLMDDEFYIRDMATLMISKLGYEIVVTENGHEACETFEKALTTDAPFDLVILDLTIPGGMGGKETLAEIKKIDPDVKAVVSSGYSNDPIMANFADYGFVDIVSKPYRIEDMSRVLKRVTQPQLEV